MKYTTKTKYINNKEYIYDPTRKKYLINSPEEWIRQNFIEYLHNKKGFPISLMSTEKLTKINSLKNRSDIVCFNRQGKPILLVECKSEKTTDKELDVNEKLCECGDGIYESRKSVLTQLSIDAKKSRSPQASTIKTSSKLSDEEEFKKAFSGLVQSLGAR